MTRGRHDRTPEFYGQDGAEVLSWTSRDEAVEMLVDGFHGQETPRTLTVVGYAKKAMTDKPKLLAAQIAEYLDDIMLEEYGNPEEATDLPKEIDDAIEALAKAIVEHWPIWQCDEVNREEVDVPAWVREHRPEWERDIEWLD